MMNQSKWKCERKRGQFLRAAGKFFHFLPQKCGSLEHFFQSRARLRINNPVLLWNLDARGVKEHVDEVSVLLSILIFKEEMC